MIADHELREMPEVADRYHGMHSVVTVDVKADKDALEEGETVSLLALVGSEEATYRQATWRIVTESLARDGEESSRGEAVLTEGAHVLNHEATLTGVKAGTVIVEVQANGITARKTFQIVEASEPDQDQSASDTSRPAEKPASRPSQVHTAVAAAPGLFAGIMTVTAGIIACAGRKGKKNRG